MAGTNVVQFTEENWQQEVLQSDKPVLVDFWAPWCGPCRVLLPIVERVATQFAGRVKVGKLNIDDHQGIAVQYGISGIPQLFFFNGSAEPVHRQVGLMNEADLVKVLNRILEEPKAAM